MRSEVRVYSYQSLDLPDTEQSDEENIDKMQVLFMKVPARASFCRCHRHGHSKQKRTEYRSEHRWQHLQMQV